jgi:hypothetical protein
MNQAIIKNISIIRQLIEIGDTDALATLVQSTQKTAGADSFTYLWNAIENERFEDALIIITDSERQARAVAMHYDPIVSALKVELHFQENELMMLVADRDDMAKKLDQFQIIYHSRMGPWLDKMLYLRKEKLAIQARTDARLKSQYELAEAEYAEFHAAHSSPIKGLLYMLNEKETREIKLLYRRASMICHPDRVGETDKEKAQAMFAELHEAYLSNDLKKVRLITELLEKTGQFEPNSNRLETSEALKVRIDWVVLEKEKVDEEIATFLSSSAYRMVDQIGNDWNAYFALSVENVQNQIAELENWHVLNSNLN